MKKPDMQRYTRSEHVALQVLTLLSTPQPVISVF